jgi:uncharacterized membrane protein
VYKNPLVKKIFLRLNEHNRLKLSIILLFSLSLSLSLIAFRIYYTGTLVYAFMVWNLFLAVIPFMFSSLAVMSHNHIKSKLFLFLLTVAWLLFFPNAPYIMTDFFHLSDRGDVPYWFDLGLLISCAWNGLMLGFISLHDMRIVINKFIGKLYGWMFAVGSIILGSFGIYLGRYERFNSWDVITNPLALISDIAGGLMHPLRHTRTMLMTLLFSVFLLFGYLTLLQLMNVKNSAAKIEQ